MNDELDDGDEGSDNTHSTGEDSDQESGSSEEESKDSGDGSEDSGDGSDDSGDGSADHRDGSDDSDGESDGNVIQEAYNENGNFDLETCLQDKVDDMDMEEDTNQSAQIGVTRTNISNGNDSGIVSNATSSTSMGDNGTPGTPEDTDIAAPITKQKVVKGMHSIYKLTQGALQSVIEESKKKGYNHIIMDLDVSDPDCEIHYLIKQTRSIDRLLHTLNLPDCSTSVSVSAVILFKRPKDAYYAVTIGRSYHQLQKYIDYMFSSVIAARILNEQGMFAKVEAPVQGRIMRQSTHCQENERPLESELAAIISYKTELRQSASIKDVCEKFRSGKTNVNVGVGYIKFVKSLDLDDYIKVMDHFTKISSGESTMQWGEENTVEIDCPDAHRSYLIKLNKTDRDKLETQLQNELIKITLGMDSNVLEECFDITPTDIENYMDASKYKLSINTLHEREFNNALHISDVLNYILANKEDLNSLKQLQNIKLEYFHDSWSKPTKLLNSFRGSMLEEGTSRKFYKMRGWWYRIEADALIGLEKQFVNVLKNCLRGENSTLRLKNTYQAKQTNKSSNSNSRIASPAPENMRGTSQDTSSQSQPRVRRENLFSKSYENEKEFILGDCKLPEKIKVEICDLLRVHNDKVYLYHIKEGFGQSTRVARSQVECASKLLLGQGYSSNHGLDVLKKYFEKLMEAGDITQKLSDLGLYPEEKFKAKLLSNPHLVYAFADTDTKYEEVMRTKYKLFEVTVSTLANNIRDSKNNISIRKALGPLIEETEAAEILLKVLHDKGYIENARLVLKYKSNFDIPSKGSKLKNDVWEMLNIYNKILEDPKLEIGASGLLTCMTSSVHPSKQANIMTAIQTVNGKTISEEAAAEKLIAFLKKHNYIQENGKINGSLMFSLQSQFKESCKSSFSDTASDAIWQLFKTHYISEIESVIAKMEIVGLYNILQSMGYSKRFHIVPIRYNNEEMSGALQPPGETNEEDGCQLYIIRFGYVTL